MPQSRTDRGPPASHVVDPLGSVAPPPRNYLRPQSRRQGKDTADEMDHYKVFPAYVLSFGNKWVHVRPELNKAPNWHTDSRLSVWFERLLVPMSRVLVWGQPEKPQSGRKPGTLKHGSAR